MEQAVKDLVNSGFAVELLVPAPRDEYPGVGVRIHPYGKGLPKDRMVLGAGETFEKALEEALDKAEGRRWEVLNWSKRPWPIAGPWTNDRAGAYGLL